MISKIEGPGSIRPPQAIKRAGKTSASSSAGFAKHLDETGEASGASGVSTTNAVSGIIGVQEVDDALAHASRGKLRAQDILDRLENLRLELLNGQVSVEKLQQLSRVVSSRRGEISDPNLLGVLDEIDLRAKVELAKYASGVNV